MADKQELDRPAVKGTDTQDDTTADAASGMITFDEYLDYLRGLVRAEKRAME